MSVIKTVTLPSVGILKMGETIIEKDCTGEGLPIYSADKSNRPWAFSTHFKRRNKTGTIVIGARGTIGHPRLPRDKEFGATQTTITLTPDSEIFQSEFVYFSLQQLDFTLLGAQQAIPMLTVGNLELVTIPKFPKPEQSKIAEILSTVDRAIEQTEALIAKQQRIKTGLMQDLLTRGIDEHGNLRSEESHPFKDSPLGRIPVEWEVCRLKSIADFVTSGSRGWAKYYSKEGALFLRIGNLTRQHINMRFEDVVRVNPPKSSEGNRTSVLSGDLLISITADLGIIGVIPNDFAEAYVNQHIALARLHQSDVDPRFVGWFLNGRGGQSQFEKLNESGAKAGLNLPTIKNLLIPTMKQEEQNQIAITLDAATQKSTDFNERFSKLHSLKTALMQDLLTGRKRVTSLLDGKDVPL